MKKIEIVLLRKKKLSCIHEKEVYHRMRDNNKSSLGILSLEKIRRGLGR